MKKELEIKSSPGSFSIMLKPQSIPYRFKSGGAVGERALQAITQQLNNRTITRDGAKPR